jgi:hypothetical protein
MRASVSILAVVAALTGLTAGAVAADRVVVVEHWTNFS